MYICNSYVAVVVEDLPFPQFMNNNNNNNNSNNTRFVPNITHESGS